MPPSPLPRYKCHKEVAAMKIAAIQRDPLPKFSRATCKGSIALGSACGNCEACAWERENGPQPGATLIPVEESCGPLRVSAAYLAKHKPEVGGYFVLYEDGYSSFSPAKAFEDGYTRI